MKKFILSLAALAFAGIAANAQDATDEYFDIANNPLDNVTSEKPVEKNSVKNFYKSTETSLSFSMYALYQKSEKNADVDAEGLGWISYETKGSSSAVTWEAIDDFAGSEYYFGESSSTVEPRVATCKASGDNKEYTMQVTGIAKVGALVNSKSTSITMYLSVYEGKKLVKTASSNANKFEAIYVGGLDKSKVYTIKLYNDDSAKSGNSHIAEVIFYNENNSTPVEDIEAENASKVVKTIENGQIIIIKNGVKYNVLGQIVK
ncbi:MAG: hypothetical protein MJZ15_01745 [Bacteroidales bacterium]|nr:hypothetical protein [Bacteroidales bacterium]